MVPRRHQNDILGSICSISEGIWRFLDRIRRLVGCRGDGRWDQNVREEGQWKVN